MVLTSDDKRILEEILNTEDKKNLVIRLCATAMLEGSTIPAHEMQRTLQVVKTKIEPKGNIDKKKYSNQAV